MTALLPLVAALCGAAPAADRPGLDATLYLQQSAVYFTSSEVTAGGLVGGLGAQLTWCERYLVQGDASVLWMLGNAVATRMALGMQRGGAWAPAAHGAAGRRDLVGAPLHRRDRAGAVHDAAAGRDRAPRAMIRRAR